MLAADRSRVRYDKIRGAYVHLYRNLESQDTQFMIGSDYFGSKIKHDPQFPVMKGSTLTRLAASGNVHDCVF